VRLALTGRSEARLIEVAERCRARGAEVWFRSLDVTDERAMRAWITDVDKAVQGFDLVVANAGVSGGTIGTTDLEAATRGIFNINVTGVWNTIFPALDCMRPRKRGQIALLSSLGGLAPVSSPGAYSAAKAAIRIYGDRLRLELESEGIGVSVIMPGFVKTNMTDQNTHKMPLLMDLKRAVAIMRNGLEKNRAVIAFPLPLYVFVWLLSCLPTELQQLCIRAVWFHKREEPAVSAAAVRRSPRSLRR